MDSTSIVSPEKSPKKKLGPKGLIVLIGMTNTVAYLSLDIYLPALPSMSATLNSNPSTVNLTIALFYLFIGIGMLVLGPLSEKFGRRVPLLVFTAVYTLGSIACALSTSVEMLIVFRIIEALGGGGMYSIGVALVKDCFPPERHGKILALSAILTMAGPMVAPIIGSVLVSFFPWYSVFVFLGILGLSCFILELFFEESLKLEDRYTGNCFGAVGRIIVVARNPRFTYFLIATSIIMIPYIGYVSVSSYIYMETFQLSTVQYALFYAVNAIFQILPSIVYAKFETRFTKKTFLNIICGGTLLTGILCFLVGGYAPIVFLVIGIPATVCECIVRPVAIPVLLAQQEKDTGAAASLISAFYTLLSSFGMIIGSVSIMGYIKDFGLLCVVFAVITFIMFFAIYRGKVKLLAFDPVAEARAKVSAEGGFPEKA